MQLNKDFPRKLYLDTKVLVNGKKKKPRDLNLEKHIELGKWVQDMIDGEEITIPCTCENTESTIPQACIKLKKEGSLYYFFSCSTDNLPEGCSKSYKVFLNNVEVYAGTNLDTIYEYIIDNFDSNIGYSIVEYISCVDGSSESLPYCFEKTEIKLEAQGILKKVQPSCKCCNDCVIKATDDIFKFEDNGLSYQFLDILHNDIFDNTETIDIEIVTKDFGGNREIEIFNSIFYSYPIIKLTKPSGSSQVGNIDTPEGFTYRITNTCGTSSIATCTIYPVSVNLSEVINDNPKT